MSQYVYYFKMWTPHNSPKCSLQLQKWLPYYVVRLKGLGSVLVVVVSGKILMVYNDTPETKHPAIDEYLNAPSEKTSLFC